MNDVQSAELGVLKEIIKVLDAHGLTYYAIGGTCIGAIRHKGFIPWDDDIDIGLPRKDYELFRTEYYKELPSYLKKLDYDNAEHHKWLFFKIHDIRTTYVSDYAEGLTDIYTGAFVDIMPMDGLPDDELARSRHFKALKRINMKNEIIKGPYKKIDSLSRFAKEAARFAIKKARKHNYYAAMFRQTAEKYDYASSKDVCYAFSVYADCPMENITFPRECFDEVIKVPFEDIELNVPKGYDRYLRVYFGDYMELPPENQRNSGHEAIACDMKMPLAQYAGRAK